MTIVLDANVVYRACVAGGQFGRLGDGDLVAPPLVWPELRSSLHVSYVRGVLTPDTAKRAMHVAGSGAFTVREPDGLGAEVWGVADELGWTKTYDAEYLTLARLLECPLATLDGRMRSAADRLGIPLWSP